MTQGFEIGGLAAALALLLPIAVLATLVVLVLARSRRRAVPIDEVTTTRSIEPALARVAAADDLVARAAAVTHAEASGKESALPGLHLALGEAQSARGLAEEARRSLTQAVRVAARLGDKQVHAKARLKLGDTLEAAGDLTTACEHWQIARGLFHELGKAGPLAEVESRMRRNGCPTDWVLNDF